MVSVSASVIFPCTIKVQKKLSFGTGLPRWSQKKGRKNGRVFVVIIRLYCIDHVGWISWRNSHHSNHLQRFFLMNLENDTLTLIVGTQIPAAEDHYGAVWWLVRWWVSCYSWRGLGITWTSCLYPFCPYQMSQPPVMGNCTGFMLFIVSIIATAVEIGTTPPPPTF